MKNVLRCGLAYGLLALAGGLAQPVQAQKVRNEFVWATFHKSPAVSLQPYASYSVDYDLGNLVMSVPNRPVLQGLTYQKADGDLLLRLTVKSLFVTGRKLNASRTRSGAISQAYYTITYKVEAGYELRDPKTDEVLASYHKTNGEVDTRAFDNPSDLNGYMANAFVAEKSQQLLEAMALRADFALNLHDYPVGLTLHTLEGEAPAYAAINQATSDLKAQLASKTPVDKGRVQAVAATWVQQLARANWDDKKSEINKKVANALLENLCAASLLTEDYAQLNTYSAEYDKRNSGVFSYPLTFETNTS
ncbi:hypothetical protein [Hymenobacter sp. BT491]|uniref:hypothetical protein n=1 Tax=Hymenobacter sp. BT491 TaxID=2766779 RepID=UPI001653C7BB|nr:hypothetical protein [Hymenobacter sp. BT491]MBC6992246.1 hypothetical protein [Hymenobacter sp. BT491]